MINKSIPEDPFSKPSAISAPGNREIIPIMINMEIPLPMPFSVIFSPNHMQNIVPAESKTKELTINIELNSSFTAPVGKIVAVTYPTP